MAIAWLTGFGDEIDSSLEIQLKHMGALDIRALELRGADGKNVAQFTPNEAKEKRRMLTGEGFVVSALGSPAGKSKIEEPFEPVADAFRRLLETAAILETDVIRMFSFFIPEGEHAAMRGEVLDRLHAMRSMARKAGIRLYHENENGIYGDTTERCLDLARELCDDSFALIFDPSNFVQGGDDTLAAWAALKPHVRYLHMKDSFIPPAGVDRHAENPHCVVGDGDGNVKDILADISRTDFKGYFSIEPHLASSKHVPGTNPEKWSAAANGLKKLLAETGIAVEYPV